MKLLASAVSDTGHQRQHNEDCYLIDTDLNLFAIADGMGGHLGGRTASHLALEVVKRTIAASHNDLAAAAQTIRTKNADITRKTAPFAAVTKPQEVLARPDTSAQDSLISDNDISDIDTVLVEAATAASNAIFEAALRNRDLQGMGTTLTVAAFLPPVAHFVHAGDSRAYLYRNQTLTQITEDHSWISEQIKTGAMTEAEAKDSQYRHVITRCVGYTRDVEVDIHTVELLPDDCLLLCTDGLTNSIEHHELEEVLKTTWYSRAPQALVDMANQRGGDDNITVMTTYVCK